MSLALYNKVERDKNKIGINLPELAEQGISCISKQVELIDVIDAVADLKPEAGWYMLRDVVMAGCELPEGREDLIEGEWSNGETTLKAKLLYGQCYLLTTMEIAEQRAFDTVYREQRIVLRPDLAKQIKQNVALYRYWWSTKDPANPGLWQPLAQQFVGFEWSDKVEKARYCAEKAKQEGEK